MTPALLPDDHPIVLFDGVCNFCEASIQFIIKRDTDAVFRFASLQGEQGRAIAEGSSAMRRRPETKKPSTRVAVGKRSGSSGRWASASCSAPMLDVLVLRAPPSAP